MGRQRKNEADVGYCAVFDLWPNVVQITYESTLLHVLVQSGKNSILWSRELQIHSGGKKACYQLTSFLLCLDLVNNQIPLIQLNSSFRLLYMFVRNHPAERTINVLKSVTQCLACEHSLDLAVFVQGRPTCLVLIQVGLSV